MKMSEMMRENLAISNRISHQRNSTNKLQPGELWGAASASTVPSHQALILRQQ